MPKKDAEKIEKILAWGTVWARFWKGLGSLLGALGRSWVPLGRFLAPLKRFLDVSWALLIALGRLLVVSWVSWTPLGAIWDRFGVDLDVLGRVWGLKIATCWVLGAFGLALGSSCELLGRRLNVPGHLQGVSWSYRAFGTPR